MITTNRSGDEQEAIQGGSVSHSERPLAEGHIRPVRRHANEKRLGPDDRAIPSPRRPPGIIEIRRTSGDREFRRELLVNLDAQTRLFLRQHVAVLDFGAAHKYLLRLFWETAAFMDAEVVTHQLERQLRGVRQRRSEERRVGKECRSRWSPYH